ncbi:MAG: SAM hydrolase/SAM-dependent halogenase family protein [Solirubrobacteraceae bacterium]
MAAPVITFLSDYGLEDEFVGVCHGVIAGICPQARIIDLTHGIPRHDIRAGAITLRGALPYVPAGVHLAVVDPDVGAVRRAIALAVGVNGGRVLVGPDNGLLWPAATHFGGVLEAVELSRSPLRLPHVSATFHGRDIFSPIAAHLAAGLPLSDVGEPCDPDELVRLELPVASLEEGALVTEVLHVDRFGNVRLSANHQDLDSADLKLGRAVTLELDRGGSYDARYVRTFADAAGDELVVYEDAEQMLAIAVSHGSAAERLGLRDGAAVRIRPRA